jgi:hypothetical protein
MDIGRGKLQGDAVKTSIFLDYRSLFVIALMAGVVTAYGATPLTEGGGNADVQAVTNAGGVRGEIQAGVGYWVGDATFSIGGSAWTPSEGSMNLPKKISELTFPLDVAYGVVEGSLLLDGRLEFHAMVMGNLNQPSTKVTDSDWGIFEDSGTLDVYSESDAELTAIQVDAGARYWLTQTAFTNGMRWAVAVGPGLLYEKLDWTVSNVDQWFPSMPQEGHVYESGKAATYSVEIVMPYLDVSAIVKAGRVSGRAEVGVGPVLVQDKDDHLLRQKKSEGEMLGIGVKAEAEIRYDFTKKWFGAAKVAALAIEAAGSQTQEGYGGDLVGFYAEIDEEFSVSSISGGGAVGYKF